MKPKRDLTKKVIKWTSILILFCLFGIISSYTEQNIWVEAIAKFAAGFFGWIFLSLVLDALFRSDGNMVSPFQMSWNQLRFRQKIWESTSWSFFILMFRYGIQLVGGDHPTLTFWNLMVIGGFFYGVNFAVEAHLKNFKCPRCHRRFFNSNKGLGRDNIFDPVLQKWPNNDCVRCGLEIWSYEPIPIVI